MLAGVFYEARSKSSLHGNFRARPSLCAQHARLQKIFCSDSTHAGRRDVLGIDVSSLLLLHCHSLRAVRLVKAVRRAIASRNTRDAEHSTLLRVRHMDDDEQLLVYRAATAT